MIGHVVGNYRIVSELGRGGMGMVYRVEHTQLGRPAALKMLLPQFSSDPGIVQRFFNEARAASAIDHPGIVEIYDYGTHADGAAYIVMALLRGETLSQRLQRGGVSPIEAASVVAQVAGALAAAHARGIVHRDLKPDNIFLVPNELMPDGIQVKLLDFGIAKLADEQTGFRTQTGALIGTPAYMSPEQCMGLPELDHRTDLYALGCILFHALTGRPPFVSAHGTGVMIAAHIRDEPPHPRSLAPATPDDLAAITLRLLAKDPAARFQTAQELRAALAAAGAHVPSTHPGAPGAYAPATGAHVPVPSRATAPVDGYAPTVPPTRPTPPAPSAVVTGGSTTGASSGQVATAVPPSRGKGVWVGAGIAVIAIAGAGAFVAMRDDATPTATTAGSATGSAGSADGAGSGSSLAALLPQGSGVAANAGVPAECPQGQERSPDTQGKCCWPQQAWSSSKARCIGTPACPPGTKARGESCVEGPPELAEVAAPAGGGKPQVADVAAPAGGGKPQVAEAEGALAEVVTRTPGAAASPPPAPPPDAAPVAIATADVPSLSLDRKNFAPGANVVVTFSRPVSSLAASRAWVAISPAGSRETHYVTWTYVADQATRVTLKAPSNEGAFEVRLHTDYPKKSYNIRATVPFSVGIGGHQDPATSRGDQRFTLSARTVAPGAKLTLHFPTAMVALPGERFWITIVEANAADSKYGGWKYLDPAVRDATFDVPRRPGDYEMRLHANYPKQATNVVHRVPFRVQ